MNVSKNDFVEILSSDLMEDAIVINASLKDNDIRNENCHKNVLHTAPSYRMATDALIQFLKKKNWTKLLLISGVNKRDKQFANSIKISSKRFGLKIINEVMNSYRHFMKYDNYMLIDSNITCDTNKLKRLMDDGFMFGIRINFVDLFLSKHLSFDHKFHQ